MNRTFFNKIFDLLCSSFMARSKGGGFYAVKRGRNIGIYMTWAECESQVKGFHGARYKKFGSEQEAQSFIDEVSSSNSSLGVRRTQTFKAKSQNTAFPGSVTALSKRTKLIEARSLSTQASSSSTSSKPVVYTDGCCRGNGRSGAIGGIGVYWGPDHPRNISEPLLVDEPTNQKAELEAAIRAIDCAIGMGLDDLELRTDSTYTIKSMTEWIPRWERNGWKTSKGTDVLNKEQMIRLNDLCKRIDIKWTHVRGHKGIHGNEEADRLANEGAMKT
ncbi:ribonuclease H1-like [Clytia hemisphaerica]|uniref:Ribonuclease H1 n=1 Tax=Clytia hemisphaerica TaxID=252671 RepID=A0A7M5VF37_9CNID|eukprot:TCONS_00001055-protein